MLRVLPPARQVRPDDAGETLIELLITVTIMSIAIVAIIASFLVATTTTVSHRKAVVANTVLTTYADELTGPGCGPATTPARPCAVTPQSPAFTYVPCALPTNVGAVGVQKYPSPVQSLPGSGQYTARITKVRFWDLTTFLADGTPDWQEQPTCNPAVYGTPVSLDKGVQQLTLEVLSRGNANPLSETLVVVKRDATKDA